MKSYRPALTLASCLFALAAVSPAHAGLGKTLMRGAAIGAGAAVGHKVANAAMNSYGQNKKEKEAKEAEERARLGLPPLAKPAQSAAATIPGSPAVTPVPEAVRQ